MTRRTPTHARTESALVTGAGGLCGSHLVRALQAAGITARAGLREARGRASSVHVDLDIPATLAAACTGVDLVFHCAARLAGTCAALERTNADGTRALLAAARAAGVRRFVYVSSCSVYRDGPVVDGGESHPRGGGSDYARSKQRAEDAVFAASRDFEVVVLRPCTVYGPSDRWFWPLVAGLVREHAFPAPLARCRTRSLVHAADLADAMVAAGTRPLASPACFNIAGERRALGEVLADVARALGVELAQFSWPGALPDGAGPEPDAWRNAAAAADRAPIPWSLVPALTTERTLDASAAERVLGFAPRRSFQAWSDAEARCRS